MKTLHCDRCGVKHDKRLSPVKENAFRFGVSSETGFLDRHKDFCHGCLDAVLSEVNRRFEPLP